MTLKNLLAKLNGVINEAFARYQANIISRRQAYYAQLAAVLAKAPALAQVREGLRKNSLLLVFDKQGTRGFDKFTAGVARRKQALEQKEIAYKTLQQVFQRAFPTPPATVALTVPAPMRGPGASPAQARGYCQVKQHFLVQRPGQHLLPRLGQQGNRAPQL